MSEAVPYESLRSRIQTGDVMLTQGWGPFCAIVRSMSGHWDGWKYQRARYTHAGFFVWAKLFDRDRLLILEAIEGVGTRLWPFSYYLNDYAKRGVVEWWPLQPGVVDRRKAVKHASQWWTGENNYSRGALLREFGFLSRPLWSRVFPKNDKYRFCSYLVTEGLQQGGLELPPGIDPSRTPPDAIPGFDCWASNGVRILVPTAGEAA